MCGIISVAFYDELDEAKSLDVLNFGKSSLRHLNHRGPDNSDIHLINNRVLMGHTRLSINGLVSEFNQPYPLRNIEDNLPRIIFNGEIFNFKELDASAMCDTKVLFNVLKRSNLNKAKLEESLRSLNGMWSFAFYNQEKNELFLSRDLLGERHLFYTIDNNQLIFSSEVKPIISVTESKNEMDFNSIVTSWKFTSSAPGKTLIKNIYRLKPGTNLHFKRGVIKVNHFQKLHF